MANTSILAAFERMWLHVAAALGEKSDSDHTHNDIYYTESEVDTKLSGKADTTHTHSISNITNLQSTLDGKAASSHGTHVSYSTTAPVMDGAAAVGTASTVARSDHKHPTDTSRAAASDLAALKSLVGDTSVSTQITNATSSKLDKTTYEYNKELALGSSGKVCIGKFPMYDSNVSVEIKSTTSTTYNGTLVIATQNINTTGGGSYTATVYGDANNALTDSIKIHYGSGSNVFSVYINLPSWSKNLLHIQCVSLSSTPTDIATAVSEIPSNATITPTNALKVQFDTKAAAGHTHDDRYYTESEVDTKISAINTVVTNITNGTTKVPKAAYADTANTATQASKATSDKNGNVITSTYATKSELSTVSNLVGNTAVSTQISTAIANKADSVHNHTTLDGVQEIRNASGTIQVNSDKLNLFANSVVLKNNPYDDFDAATKYYVDTSMSSHNTNTAAHADIRNQISQLSSDIAAINRDGIIQEVIAALQTPVFGRVDENNNIILTGELVDGTYTLKYEYEDGTLTTIGTLSHSSNDPTYTNLANPSSAEWVANKRLNSSGAIADASVYGTGGAVTNFIPCKVGDVIRVKGMDVAHYYTNASGQLARATAYFYAENKTTIIAKNIPDDGNGWVETDGVWTYTVGTSLTAVSGSSSDICYARLTGVYGTGTANDVVITVNQEI